MSGSPDLVVRRQGERISEVTRAWEGETVVCIAGGPSLTREQLELVREANVKTAVVNDAYLVAPWAQLLYAADASWWKLHTEGISKTWPWASFSAHEQRKALGVFAGQKCTIEHPDKAGIATDVHVLKNDSDTFGQPDGLSEKPDAIRTGRNSGYQTINLVALSRPRRIVLVAYDMKIDGKRTHSHNGHPNGSSNDFYRGFVPHFNTMRDGLERLGVEVVNCTPGSAIKSFPEMPLALALE